MHPAIFICIILAILITALAIIFAIKENDGAIFVMIFFIGTIAIVGGIGFGMVCGTATWNNTYEKILPDKVETFIFKENGIVASAYNGCLYQSTEIEHLNAINNIDYYALVRKSNAYGNEIARRLYPVEKGKIDDYIKEK